MRRAFRLGDKLTIAYPNHDKIQIVSIVEIRLYRSVYDVLVMFEIAPGHVHCVPDGRINNEGFAGIRWADWR